MSGSPWARPRIVKGQENVMSERKIVLFCFFHLYFWTKSTVATNFIMVIIQYISNLIPRYQGGWYIWSRWLWILVSNYKSTQDTWITACYFWLLPLFLFLRSFKNPLMDIDLPQTVITSFCFQPPVPNALKLGDSAGTALTLLETRHLMGKGWAIPSLAGPVRDGGGSLGRLFTTHSDIRWKYSYVPTITYHTTFPKSSFHVPTITYHMTLP